MIGIGVVGLALAGCGSDGDSGGGGPQAAAAAATIQSASEAGLTLDEGCVNDLAAQLSDADAEAIAADGDAEISAEGQALGAELLGCADADALVDVFIAGMNESGQPVDEDCARDKLEGVDIPDLVAATQGGDMPSDLVAALVECVDIGG